MSSSFLLSNLSAKARFIGEFLLALCLLNIPFINIPFKWLETFFHEFSHALVTLMTGGEVMAIKLYFNGAGVCISQGGWPLLIAVSGYLGATCFGWWLFILAVKTQQAKQGYLILGLMLLACFFFWANDLLTMVILWTILSLVLLPLRWEDKLWPAHLLRILALVVLCNAFTSAFSLFGVAKGDALLMRQLTFIPAWVWVMLWSAFSLFALSRCWQLISIQQEKLK